MNTEAIRCDRCGDRLNADEVYEVDGRPVCPVCYYDLDDDVRELQAMLHTTHPADIREVMRAKLHQFPQVARRVYDRANIHDPATPLIHVVETVLYHFDPANRARVAQGLALDEESMTLLLVGYVLGHEGRL
jgi:hypothetical protein